MKILTTAFAGLMLAIAMPGFSQEGGVIVTSAPTVEAAINSTASDLSAKLTQLLDEAKTQNENLENQLKRIGDPSTVNSGSVAMIKQDLQKSATTLKTTAEQHDMIATVTGSEVFSKDAYGLMTPIGSTVTVKKKDGTVRTVVNRDPSRYKLEAAIASNIDDFNRVYDEAVARKKELTDEIGSIIVQINDAQDLATVAKLNAMLDTVRGQIAVCDSDILSAKAKADMVEKDMSNQASIISKGKQEEAALKKQNDGTPGTVSEETANKYKNAMKLPSSLPWGKKGSDGNPSSGTGTGSGSGTGGATP